jgi:hypothetical protein
MEAMQSPDGSFTPSLLLSVGLLLLCVLIITQLRDAPSPQPTTLDLNVSD